MNRELVLKARQFAKHAHRGQLRRYTNDEYFAHLCEVAQIVDSHRLGDHAVAVAYLHDTIEDTAATADMIAHEFGGEIAVDVVALSNYSKFFGNHDQRHRLNCQRIACGSSIAKSVKCADLISNTSSIVRHDPGFAVRYLKEEEDVLYSIEHGFYEVAHDVLLKQAWESLWAAQHELKGAIVSGPVHESRGPFVPGERWP